jgi:hypothetical protein
MDGIQLLTAAQEAYSLGDYVAALEIVYKAEQEGKTSPELLLIKGACVQLAENTDFPAEKAFEIYSELLRRRPMDPRALNEMGHFLLNVKGDAQGARRYFNRCLTVYGQLYLEAARGLVRVDSERGRSIHECIEALRSLMDRLESDAEIEARGH